MRLGNELSWRIEPFLPRSGIFMTTLLCPFRYIFDVINIVAFNRETNVYLEGDSENYFRVTRCSTIIPA